MNIRTPLAWVVMLLTLQICLYHSAPLYAESDDAFAKSMEKFLQSDKGRDMLITTLEELQEYRQKKAADREVAQVEEQFQNPVKIEAGSSPAKGPAGAKVTIIEFSDFQCPFCDKGRQTIEKVLERYPKDVKLVFKHLPLPFHDQAMPAAKAAMAAARQGKFWEMHDALFANQKSLNNDFFLKQATTLALDVEKFKKDMNDPELEKQIKADAELASSHGINGTPGFFVNGVAVKGAYPEEHFQRIIDRWLSGNASFAGAAAKKS